MIAKAAVTIDFHNTLFDCDAWFELEVRQLLPAFLDWLAVQSNTTFSAVTKTDAAARYNELRREIIRHGDEMDAVECVLCISDDLRLGVDRGAVERGLDALMRPTLATAQPRDGAVELVRELREAGLRLGIISNAVYHPFILWSLEAYGLTDAFDVISSSASTGFYKTRPEIYSLTLEALGVLAANAVHVGDSHRFDVLGAARAGMKTVWLTSDPGSVAHAKADLIVPSLHGLAAPLRHLLDRASQVTNGGTGCASTSSRSFPESSTDR